MAPATWDAGYASFGQRVSVRAAVLRDFPVNARIRKICSTLYRPQEKSFAGRFMRRVPMTTSLAVENEEGGPNGMCTCRRALWHTVRPRVLSSFFALLAGSRTEATVQLQRRLDVPGLDATTDCGCIARGVPGSLLVRLSWQGRHPGRG